MAITLLKMDAANPNLPGQLKRDDIWTCKRCGWTYPNAHPSAKVRRNHKKNCGKIKGFEIKEHNQSLEGSLEGSSFGYVSSDDDNGNGQATDFCMDKSGDFTDYPSCLLHKAIAKNGSIELETETEMEMESETAIQPIQIKLVDSNAIVLKSKEAGDFGSSIVSEKEDSLPPLGGGKYEISSQTEINKDDHKCKANSMLSSEKGTQEKADGREGYSTKLEEKMVDYSLQNNSNEEITTYTEDIATAGSLSHPQALLIERVSESENFHRSIEINLNKSQYKNIKNMHETTVNHDLNVVKKEEKKEEEEVPVHVQESLGKALGGDHISPHKEEEKMLDSSVHKDSSSTSFNDTSENIDTCIEDTVTVGRLSNSQDLVIERVLESEDCTKSTEINSNKSQCSLKDVPETIVVNHHDINAGKEDEEVQVAIHEQEILEECLENDNFPHKEEEKIANSSTIYNDSSYPLSQDNENITTLTEDIAAMERLSHPKDIVIEGVLDRSEDCKKSIEMNLDNSECSIQVVTEIRLNCDINVNKEEEEEVVIPVPESSGNSLGDDDSPHKEETEGSSQHSSATSTFIPQKLYLGEEKVAECIATELKEAELLPSFPTSEPRETNQDQDFLDGGESSLDLNQREKVEILNEQIDGNKSEMDDKISDTFDHRVDGGESSLDLNQREKVESLNEQNDRNKSEMNDTISDTFDHRVDGGESSLDLNQREKVESLNEQNDRNKSEMDDKISDTFGHRVDQESFTLAALDKPSPLPRDNLVIVKRDCPVVDAEEKEEKCQFVMPTSPKMQISAHTNLEGNLDYGKELHTTTEEVPIMSSKETESKTLSFHSGAIEGRVGLLKNIGGVVKSSDTVILRKCRSQGQHSSGGHQELLQSKSYARSLTFAKVSDMEEISFSIYVDAPESLETSSISDGYESMDDSPFNTSQPFLRSAKDMEKGLDVNAEQVMSSSSSSSSNSTSSRSSRSSSPSPNQQGPVTPDETMQIGPKDHVGDLSQAKDNFEETGVADTSKEEEKPRAPLHTLLAKEVMQAAVVATADSPKAKKKKKKKKQQQQKNMIIGGKEGSPAKAKKKGWSFLKSCICSPSVK